MTQIDRHILNLVRDGDRARYVSALLAPSSYRDQLLSLYAFDLEISAIPDRVIEPLAGEIRLQWWRDLFDRADLSSISGNPVADGIIKLVRENNLANDLLIGVLDTQSHLFHENPVPDQAALERVFDARYGAIFSMACTLLSANAAPKENLIRSAANAAGYTASIAKFGKHASKRRLLIPPSCLQRHSVDLAHVYQGEPSDAIVSMLDEIRAKAQHCLTEAAMLIRQSDPCLMPAFAHLTLLRRVLDESEKAKKNPFLILGDANPFLLQWRIWRCARTRKI